MSRTLAIDTSLFQEIAMGNLQALVTESERFRRAVVDDDEASKLDNQMPNAADTAADPIAGSTDKAAAE